MVSAVNTPGGDAAAGALADLEVNRVVKRLRRPHRRRVAVVRRRSRQLLFDPRAVGLRQDHAAAHDCGLQRTRRRRHPHQGPVDEGRGTKPQPVNMVFQHLALFPMMIGRRQRRLRTRRSAAWRAPRSRDASARCSSASVCPARRPSGWINSPAARSNVWPSRAAWCSSRRCCCWTSRWARST